MTGRSTPGRTVREWLARSAVRTAGIALLVCVAYYVGSRIGLVLRFPPATPSVLWPPNAILTVTLLLTAPRRWWIYLLAALPAHLIIQLNAGWPALLIALLFATNCSEALIATLGVRRFSDAPARFDTLRRVAVFIGAAGLAAPFVSSFADAAAVSWLRAEPYWVVWRTRFFSNVLTELTLVPALVTASTAGPAWILTAPTRRRLEAALLGVTLLFVGIMAFGLTEGLDAIPGTPYTPLALALPLFLWAAVRFGPGGVSLSLVTIVWVAIWAGTHGHGLFTALPPAQAVLALQVFLSVVAIPFMCLAGVIEERRQTRDALAERLRFETLLSNLSAMFAAGPVTEVDRQIETGLRRIVEDLDVDRATVGALEAPSDKVRVTHSWTREGVPSFGEVIRGNDAPWIVSQLRQGQVVRVVRPGDLPDEAAVDRQSLARFGTRSAAVVPLALGGSVAACLAVATLRAERHWPEALVPRLRILADLFASALARRDAERTAHESATQIQTLAGRLITAQEEERRRIARELHDGVNQKLSALSIALTSLGRRPPSSAADLTEKLARLQERAAGLVDEVRHLSHELHPGVLQHVGLVAALQGYCEEFEDEHGLSVTFGADEDLEGVPVDRALCLYRAAQEALGNVAKHAKARHVRVTVTRDHDDVRLTVADDGCGFDVTEARGRGGLGLISLDERVRLVGGRVTIHSRPQGGTEVRIVVPLSKSPDAAPDGPAR